MKIKKPGLLLQIAAAIVTGIAAGMFFPDFCIRTLNTFREIFGQFIRFIDADDAYGWLCNIANHLLAAYNLCLYGLALNC